MDPAAAMDQEQNNNNDDDSEQYEPEYEEERFVVGEQQMIPLEVLSLVPPPLEYMSNLHTQQQEISGRQVWCGSLLLAQNLCYIQHREQKDIFCNKRILELGSGTGLLGMVVSKLGDTKPSCVVLTDGDHEAIDLLQKNIENPNNQLDLESVKVKYLRWGESLTDLYKLCKESWPTLWNNTNHGFVFDYLIAGDVLYKTELPDLFFQSVWELLDISGTLFLCHVHRSTVTHDIVVEAAKSKQLYVETIPIHESTNMEGCPLEDIQNAKIYQITKSPPLN